MLVRRWVLRWNGFCSASHLGRFRPSIRIMTPSLLIGLSAVIVAFDEGEPQVLCTRRDNLTALPFGAFDPKAHRTFDLALRGWVREQTGFDLGYVEQLYTFGDRNRETPDATVPGVAENTRVISVGYLALVQKKIEVEAGFEAKWLPWYRFFPWEDRRVGPSAIVREEIVPSLMNWAGSTKQRINRINLAFGLSDVAWIEERALERYELLYEANLVAERRRDSAEPQSGIAYGSPMASDHRRILATAISRLRGKVKYRPVLFDLIPEKFTLSHLQSIAEGLLGQRLHTQNFRRGLERTKLVKGTGEMRIQTGGRPAEYHRFQRLFASQNAPCGIAMPVL